MRNKAKQAHYHLPKEVIENELHRLQLDLTEMYASLKAGNDFNNDRWEIARQRMHDITLKIKREEV
jgi:hypothetical protein